MVSCGCLSFICISIHALLAESDGLYYDGPDYTIISIHALLAESDHGGCGDYFEVEISIHALLAESDCISAGVVL